MQGPGDNAFGLRQPSSYDDDPPEDGKGTRGPKLPAVAQPAEQFASQQPLI